MQTYTVVGEYGPTGDMNITLEIEAYSEAHARNQFCETMETEYPHEWKRMGRRNVHCMGRRNVHCMGTVQPPVEPPQGLETYEATFRNQTFSIILSAESFLDAVDEVKNDCRRLDIPLSDVIKIAAI